jgi:hypothetical protein
MWQFTLLSAKAPYEPDILTPFAHHTLTVLDADQNLVFEMPAPKSGWSQRMLESVTAHLFLPESDAFLGDTWVGSTEI